MARRKRRQARRWVTVTLVVVAVLLLGAVGVGAYMLVRMFQADVTAESVTVPDLAEMERADAENVLRAAQLVPRQARSDYNETVPAGRIYRQDPAPGQVVRPGRPVRYYVSLGRATFTVPDLIGEPIEKAPELLQRAGLRLGNVKRVYTRHRPSGRIVNQNPKLGHQSATPIPVDVVVADSTNVPKVVMPDLLGLQLTTAEELLTRPDTNLQLAVVEYVAYDMVTPGTVVEQRPAPGGETDMGSRVQVKVGIPSHIKALPAKQLRLHIRIPDGPEKQLVKVKVNDALGEKVDYSGEHSPGEIVERTVDVEGDAKVRVFLIDDKTPWREELL